MMGCYGVASLPPRTMVSCVCPYVMLSTCHRIGGTENVVNGFGWVVDILNCWICFEHVPSLSHRVSHYVLNCVKRFNIT